MSEILVIEVFCDTNTLIYSHDNRDRIKKARSIEWLRELASNENSNAVVNLQVLNEFANVLIKKKWHNNIEDVFSLINEFSMLGTSSLTISTFAGAKSIVMATNYNWWDCLLLASAKELNCTHFLSEDMTDNHNVNGVTIINPFLHLPSEII